MHSLDEDGPPHRLVTCAIILIVKFYPNLDILGTKSERVPVTAALPFPPAEEFDEDDESTLIKTVGWISAGLGAVALGLFIGREMRQRYKFNRRTPYDVYSHSGDEQDVDFGLGI